MGTCSVSSQPTSSEARMPRKYNTVSLPDSSPEQLCKAVCFTVINNWSQLSQRAESLQRVCEWNLHSITPYLLVGAQQNKLLSSSSQGVTVPRETACLIKRKDCYRGRAKGPLHFLHLKESASFAWKEHVETVSSSKVPCECVLCVCVHCTRMHSQTC